MLAFYIQQISDKPGHTVKARPCGFCKKNLPLLFSSVAFGDFAGERIFFSKALPLCPAFSGAVLNKKPASAMRADLKKHKKITMKIANGRGPPPQEAHKPQTCHRIIRASNKHLNNTIMETKVKDNSKAVNNTKNDKSTAFVNGNPVNKESKEVTKPQPEAEKPKEEAGAVKAEAAKEAEAPKAQASEQPKAEEAKAEPKPEPKPQQVKHVLNLEETLKLVAELNRRKIQRDKLLETITNLDAFEIELKEDADETDGNMYQGCVLTIEDDNRRKFTTKNPVIIWTVAQQVNSMCVGKLSEIEAGIILPQ